MNECLVNQLESKAKVISFDQQDGLNSEKDGVKFYEGYFNAEIKFIANSGIYIAGDSYKIIKGTILFMKTENGWNCQSFDFSKTELIKINDSSDNHEKVATQNSLQNEEQKNTSQTQATEPQINKNYTEYNIGLYQVGGSNIKAYFHNLPDVNTKRKGYLVSFDRVYVEKVNKEFGYVTFTNPNNVVTKGWIKMNLLIAE